MKSWLIFAHITDKEETDEFYRNFKKCKSNLDKDTTAYILRIYNKKLANVFYITNETMTIILKNQQRNSTIRSWLKKLVNFIKTDAQKQKTNIQALSYYGHGGSVVIGRWCDPFLGISDFTKYIIKPFNFKLVTMDSCYMGGLTSMYEIAPYCKFVAASPSWHPNLSISSLKTFGKLPSSNDDEIWKNYTRLLTCEFKRTGNKPKYSSLIPIDVRNLVKLVNRIKILKLTKDTVLKLNDPQQFDLYLSITDKHLAEQIRDTVISKTCITNSPERINGISVREPDPEDPWHKYFLKTKWSKVLKNITIISDETVKHYIELYKKNLNYSSC
jgi:hypothetical protein